MSGRANKLKAQTAKKAVAFMREHHFLLEDMDLNEVVDTFAKMFDYPLSKEKLKGRIIYEWGRRDSESLAHGDSNVN